MCAQQGVPEALIPGKYLRIPMSIWRGKATMLTFLLECIEQNLQGWSNHSLSKAAKITLLKITTQFQTFEWICC